MRCSFFVGLMFAVGCLDGGGSGGTGTPAQGAQGGACLPDGTCNAGLSCDAGSCKGATGSGGTPGTGGDQSTGGTPGTGGTRGTGGTPGTGGMPGTGGTPDGSGGSGAGGSGAGGSPGGCDQGETWCPGCTAGEGFCSLGGCPGFACDQCSSAATLEDCDARSDCHPVFEDPGTCGCAQVGCCARYASCAQGATANCDASALGCLAPEPFCESPAFVLSYTASCYEGCVRPEDCAQ